MLNLDYTECLAYIEENENLRLTPSQKIMLYYLLQGKEVRTATGINREAIVRGIGNFVTYKLCKNHYEKQPDITIPYTMLVDDGLISQTCVDYLKSKESPEVFAVEEEGKWPPAPEYYGVKIGITPKVPICPQGLKGE